MSASAGDSTQVTRQVADLEADVIATLEGVRMVRGTMGRVLAAWDSYSDIYTSMRAWLEQGPHAQRHGQSTEVNKFVHRENFEFTLLLSIHVLGRQNSNIFKTVDVFFFFFFWNVNMSLPLIS